jgi:hypothetical protein
MIHDHELQKCISNPDRFFQQRGRGSDEKVFEKYGQMGTYYEIIRKIKK